MKKIITHNGDFHADDVFAVATLCIYLNKQGEKYEIIRSQDEKVWETGDYVLDTGFIYDPKKNRFDHHQKGGAGNGLFKIPYSSFGLIWKHFAAEICDNKNVWKKIQENFVTQIDANDNGVAIYKATIKELEPLDPEVFIFAFRPKQSEKTEESLYKGFLKAVEYAKLFLLSTIEKELEKESFRPLWQKAWRNKNNFLKIGRRNIFLIEESLPWQNFLAHPNNLDFIVLPRLDGKWMARGIPKEKGGLACKIPANKKFAGLGGEVLSRSIQVPDLIFYHNSGFMLVGKTKESVLTALQKI